MCWWWNGRGSSSPTIRMAGSLRVFEMLAAERTPLIAYHFPWPGIGYLGQRGDGYRYFPALMQTAL